MDARSFPHHYYPWYEDEMTTPPAHASRPAVWQRAVDAWTTQLPLTERSFVHRDFHPGNVLSQRDVVTGVVDWSAACVSPRGCDVAHCRWNLRRWVGDDAAIEFVRRNEALTGWTLDPIWIIAGPLEHDHGDWTRAQLDDDERDLERALAELDV